MENKIICEDDVCKLDLTAVEEGIEDGEIITRIPLGICPWCNNKKEVNENGG